MECPYCKHSFRLTWSRYFSAWKNRVSCPSCSRPSRLDWPGVYFAFYGACAIVGLTAARVLSVSMFPGQYHSAAAHHFRLGFYVAFVVVIVVPIDKWFDSRIRRLVKL